ncbi:MAG TPA: hypothetical protein VMW40_07735 [Candidatus Bathyarchaeia archaeon]|nr:hypothetical protein [Candidatus Bathyarchaeia archaeon]
MAKEKSFSEFTMKDWKNFGIYLVLIGLLIMFVANEWLIGLGFFLVGIIFLAIFQGPKILKILKKENW